MLRSGLSARLATSALVLGAFVSTGCRRKAAQPSTAENKALGGKPAAYACPPSEAVAKAVVTEKRSAVAGCLAYEVGRFWLGAVLSQGEGGADPKLQFVAGGSSDSVLVFDVIPAIAPAGPLSALLGAGGTPEITVRAGQGEGSLLRVGVNVRKGQGPEANAEEVVVVLKLVAHAAPQLLWFGAGDKAAVVDGCFVQRHVEFQTLFGRVERLTSETGRRSATATGSPDCSGGPGFQEPIASAGRTLGDGKRVPWTAAAAL